jgi:D-2-hydroxyacid dehydrogenase (NADP+)
MTATLLVSEAAQGEAGALIARVAQNRGQGLSCLTPAAIAAAPGRLAEVTGAWFSRDIFAAARGGSNPTAMKDFFAVVDAAPALDWLHVMSAGADFPEYRGSQARGVKLTTSSGVTSVPIAHTVLAAILAQARGFPGWLEAQSRRVWQPMLGAASPRDLGEQTAVIVGLGPIGREVARLLRAFGMKTLGVRQQDLPCPEVDRTLTYQDLDTVLPDCDWLVLACPLSPLTRGLLDARRLALLPRCARVINVGRGAVIDEAALSEALANQRLAGAYLDVFSTEPLPPTSPLWALPNVWISPHNAAAALGNPVRDRQLFLDNLGHWLSGEPLLNLSI